MSHTWIHRLVAEHFRLNSARLEIREDAETKIDQLMQMLPSGSGIDAGFTLESCTPIKVVLSFGYHHMNEAGYYTNWTQHTAVIRPAFDGIDIRITGRNQNDIKEYLGDLLHYAVTSIVTA